MEQFDFEKAVAALQNGQELMGKDGILTPLIKQLTEAALQAELAAHLDEDEQSNRKNGSGKKTVKSSSGSFELNTPRDRNGSFEPQLVKKHQTHLTDSIERKILSLYGLGMSYQSVQSHIEELYGLDVSTATISTVTDKLIPLLKEWQQRPLESHYPFLWLDAIHYKIREDGRYQSKAIYTILGVNLEGKKEVLGLYLSESKEAAKEALDQLDKQWGDKYPLVINSWRSKWDNLSVYFRYPEEIRRIIYTTNIIEVVHRQFRKLTKTKGGQPKQPAEAALPGNPECREEVDYADTELELDPLPVVDIF